jgi:hypothetical protein
LVTKGQKIYNTTYLVFTFSEPTDLGTAHESGFVLTPPACFCVSLPLPPSSVQPCCAQYALHIPSLWQNIPVVLFALAVSKVLELPLQILKYEKKKDDEIQNWHYPCNLACILRLNSCCNS